MLNSKLLIALLAVVAFSGCTGPTGPQRNTGAKGNPNDTTVIVVPHQ